MNLCITNRCNRHCEYCMWKNWFDSNVITEPQDMGTSVMEDIMKFFNEKKSYVLCGGEPLLHPDITGLLDVMKKYKAMAIIRSNLLAESSLLRKLTEGYRDVIFGWQLNLDLGEGEGKIFSRNFFDFIINNFAVRTYITLCPGSSKIDAAFGKILDCYKQFDGKKPPVYLYFKTPILNEKFEPYDYTEDLQRNVELLYKKCGECNLVIDQPMTSCELNKEQLKAGLPNSDSVRFDLRVHSGLCNSEDYYIMPNEMLVMCPANPKVHIDGFAGFMDEKSFRNSIEKPSTMIFKDYRYDDICRTCSSFNPGLCISWCPTKRTHLNEDK